MAKFFGSAEPIQGSVHSLGATDRLTFIKKVYGYFTFSLIITAIGGYVGFKFIMDKLMVGDGYGFGPLFIGLVILEIIALIVAYVVRKKDPFNKVMLAIYSFLSGMTLGPILSVAALAALGSGAGAGTIIIQAFLITAVVFVGLTVYVYVSKKDFSFMGGALYMLLFVAIGVGLMFMFFPQSRGMNLVYSGLVALLFAGFMLYDTSMIMRRFTTDEYIAGAITLQLDFVIFFIHILRILILISSSRD
jgi:modulator of FtsH protease